MPESIRPAALVTGATGFIGAHLAQRLVREGVAVRLLVRAPERLSPELRSACTVVTGDLAAAQALDAALDQVQTVFHCAGNVSTWDTRDHYWSANVAGARALMSAIARRPGPRPRLVHVSTVDVYGFPRQPAGEERAPAPGPFGYGASKLAGEMAVRESAAAAGIACTVLRPCNVIGPGSQFVARVGAELANGLMLRVDGGRAHAGLLHVHTLVDVLLWAARDAQAVGQVYNVRDAMDVSWAEFLREFRTRIDGRGRLLDLPFRVADTAAHLIASTQGRLFPRHEPLLHPLIVRIFGRTCGHGITRLQAHGGLGAGSGFAAMMDEAADWFLHVRDGGVTRR